MHAVDGTQARKSMRATDWLICLNALMLVLTVLWGGALYASGTDT
jgi:hypothetical protein